MSEKERHHCHSKQSEESRSFTCVQDDKTSNDAVCAEARSWVGTPYHHQASMKQVGCDCLGLVRGVWRAVRGNEPEIMPAYTKEWAEVHGAESLLEAAKRHLVEIPSPLAGEGVAKRRMRDFLENSKNTPLSIVSLDSSPAGGEQVQTLARDIIAGDVLLFRMRPNAVVKHAGIYIGGGKFIHAYEHAGVVEAEFSEFWQRKLAGVFGWGEAPPS